VKLAAVSVDLDEIANYFAIHGLEERAGSHPARPDTTSGQVYDIAVDRLMDWAKREGFPLTLFAIGADLSRDVARSKLRDAARAGHEIANHSQNHRYDLTRLSKGEMRAEIDLASDAIERATGTRPVGFRAPGYTVTDELLAVVRDLGFAYDSSVFPCPLYYGLKTTKIALIAAAGRASQSIVDDPRVLLAPTRPYRIGDAYHQRGEGLIELPIQVTRGLRVPFIGTFVTMAGATGARLMAKMCVGEPLVNFELHGIDVLDASDGLEALTRHQPDVRIPWRTKLDALTAAIHALQNAGYKFSTLNAAASHL